jgi:hypothetical protein
MLGEQADAMNPPRIDLFAARRRLLSLLHSCPGDRNGDQPVSGSRAAIRRA